MSRAKTTKNVFDKKPGKIVSIGDPVLSEAIGKATRRGCWLIYGAEKNGKTWFSCRLAKELAKPDANGVRDKVYYISAEEGLEDSFKGAMKRAGITTADRVLWDEYLTIEEMVEKFSKPKSANIIFVDNLTLYKGDLTPKELKIKLLDKLPDKLFVFVAHEERKEPAPDTARMAKKLAKVIVHVQGLTAFVTSRFSAGGEIVIDEEKSKIFWGNK